MSIAHSDDDKEDISVLLDAGQALLRAGRAEAALREFDDAYDIAIAWRVEADAGQDALEALVQCACWQAVGHSSNDDWESAEAKTYELLQLTLDTAAELTPSDHCAIYYTRGKCYLEFGGYDDAIACFDWALAHDASHTRALRDRVRASRGIGDWADAHAHAVAAIAADPDSVDLRVELVKTLLDTQSADEAEAEARDILQNVPERQSMAYLLLARVLAAQDRRDEALECCDRALALDPGDQTAAAFRSSLVDEMTVNSAEFAADVAAPERGPEPRPRHDPRDVETRDKSDHDANSQDVVDPLEKEMTDALEKEMTDALERETADALVNESADAPEEAPAEPLEKATEQSREGTDRATRAAKALAAAERYRGSEDYAQALQQYESAAEIDPENRKALYGQLECLRLGQDFTEASARVRRALDASPDDWALHYEFGRLLSAQGVFRDAEGSYKTARDRYRQRQRHEREGSGKADDFETSAIEINICVALSAALCGQLRYAAAERAVSELLRKYPSDCNLREEQAWIALDSGRTEEAERYFEGVYVKSAREHSKNVYKEGARPAEPTVEFEETQAELAKASYCRGYVALAKGNHNEALSYLKEAVDAAPGVSGYKLSYAWANAASDGEANWQKAVDICRVMADKASNHLAETCMGVAYFKLREYGDSKDHLQRAQDINRTASAHADIGAFHLRRNHPGLAEEELREAIRLDPDHVFARCELGDLLLEQGLISEAMHEFRVAESVQGTVPAAAVVGLSRCYVEQGRFADAERALNGALRLVVDSDVWRLRVALAYMLIRRGQKDESAGLFEEAHSQALEAIRLKGTEADPYFRAGAAAVLCGSRKNQFDNRRKWYKRAKRHLTNCLHKDENQFEARRLLESVTGALGEERRGMFGPVVLFVLAIFFFLGMTAGIVTDMVNRDPMPAAFVAILAALFVVCLVFAFYNGQVEKISISKVLEMQFTPGRGDVPFGSVGNLSIGTDRLDLPPQPFWRVPRRSHE
jgi:tetratricopeptide (TPR) repeat protein